MQRILSFLIGATIGGMVSASLVLLYAPASGQEVRNQFNDRVKNFAREVRQASSTRRIELQERLEVLRSPRM